MSRLPVLVCVAAVVFSALIYSNEALTCRNCADTNCTHNDITQCKFGLTSDICGCCDVCAKGPGEECGGIFNHGGTCGEGFICLQDPPVISNQRPGKCVVNDTKPSVPVEQKPSDKDTPPA